MLQRDKNELQKHRANNKKTLAVCVFKWMQDPKPEDFNQAHITKEDVKKPGPILLQRRPLVMKRLS